VSIPLASISVVVPTRNEVANIPHLLASVPRGVEVVVCDASTDATRQVVHRLRPDSLVLPAETGTIAEARQRGADVSNGQVLVFTDADVVFDPDYFTRLAASSDWDGLCGTKLSRTEHSRYYQLVALVQRATYARFRVAGATGSNMVMTRSALAVAGGFRSELPCNEDTELFLRAGRLGLRIRFDRHLVVWARDHRRLRSGLTLKSVHSLVRNLLLYAFCRRPRLPRFLIHDWGYWS
jgi:glycosyltransferase involved in cell wall biosynthesis